MAKLSVASSRVFRECLATIKKKKQWSYTVVASKIGCSRKTAINLLKKDCNTAIKLRYADRLAPYLSGDPPWSVASFRASYSNSVKSILTDWEAAQDKKSRRSVAHRLAGFLSEYAVCYFGLHVRTTVETTALANPYGIAMTIVSNTDRATSRLLFLFDVADRRRIPMLLYRNEIKVYSGHLNHSTLRQLLSSITNEPTTRTVCPRP